MKTRIIGLFLFATLATAGASERVEFHIAKGTGDASWNSPETTVKLKIGDTLRIVNDDDVVHRLHTFGRPCAHQPADSQPGDFYDCELSTTADPRVDTLYDHNFGVKSRFFLSVSR